jgi:hypothetical protein
MKDDITSCYLLWLQARSGASMTCGCHRPSKGITDLCFIVGQQGLHKAYLLHVMYEGRLQSSWTHLITLSQNFVEMW